MRTRRCFLVSFGAAVAAALPTLAQEGHPLTGTWHGSWGPNAAQRTDITFVILWDGKNINGIINPGFEAMRMENATLEGKGWLVHIEAQAKEGGNSVRVVVEGKIENVTNARRSISGTWTQGSRKGDFKVVRDN